MIVRINQLDLDYPPDQAGWPPSELAGSLRYDWPRETIGYDVLVLEQDESHRKLDEDFRRQQLRKLIPNAIAAIKTDDEQIVVRLDGPVARGELVAGFDRVLKCEEPTRSAFSSLRNFDLESPSIASLRVAASPNLLALLAGDVNLGLDKSVRLRVFAVPEECVDPLLDIDSVEDERWTEILSHSGFVLGTTRGLRSLQILTPRFAPAEIKKRITERLRRPAVA
jgi:hypothetical protein